MSDKQNNRSTLNIPAGNSPITPDDVNEQPDVPLSGNTLEDVKKAAAQINVAKDFQDMTKWPCTRNSLMYGIMSGTGIGALRFLGARNPLVAGNWAVGTFTLVSIVSWNVCLTARKKELAKMRMIQEKFPHRHISNLKRQGAEWVPPPSSTSSEQSRTL